MKLTTYKCDNAQCNNETDNLKDSQWLEIGSDNSTFKVNNYLKDRKLISMSRYSDLHFCSSKCFIDEFITQPNPNR